jgi:hypothetical protein
VHVRGGLQQRRGVLAGRLLQQRPVDVEEQEERQTVDPSTIYRR